MKSNIVLIGMPGSGKSTIGPLLAKTFNKEFLDTDEVIRNNEKRELRDIVNESGHETFLQIQEKTLLQINVRDHVIATGGSVVYSGLSMQHLGETGTVVYLQIGFEEVGKRLDPGRRFARRSDQSLLDIYNERKRLYEKYAEITVECDGKTADDIVKEISAYLR